MNKRPRCDKIDEEKGLCPKGVPVFSHRNYDAWLVFSVLATQRVSPETGLVSYDGSLVREVADLFEVDVSCQHTLAVKVLYLISETNKIRLERLRDSQKTKPKMAVDAAGAD